MKTKKTKSEFLFKVLKILPSSIGFTENNGQLLQIRNDFASYHICVDDFYDEVGVLLSSGDIAYFKLKDIVA